MSIAAGHGGARLEAVVNLCKRRGFVFPSAEIYGGIRSTYDYGPLGALMLRNVREAWWRAMVQERDDVVPIEAAILTNPKVWEASGHLATFTDPVEDDSAVAYLRPETAQGMFVNFANVMTTMRLRPPFGIAQIGRSFRNEITPGNFVFRTREFEQMELEYFVPPAEAARYFDYWCQERLAWYERLGIPKDQLRLRRHAAEELSHYSAGTADIEFAFPWGWGELEGIANRTDYDLRAHAAHAGVRLEFYDQASGERYVPHVIEPAAGATRTMMAFLLAAYDEDEVGGERRTVLRLHPRLAPYQVAVLPLSRRAELTALARQVLAGLRSRFVCAYDDAQSIGRRYRRQDEIGTPLCVTVDFDSLEDGAATVRDRDTTEQVRLPLDALGDELARRVG